MCRVYSNREPMLTVFLMFILVVVVVVTRTTYGPLVLLVVTGKEPSREPYALGKTLIKLVIV